jgi:hypothetical protein
VAYYSVHPVVFGRDSRLISSDLVGNATAKVTNDNPGSVGIFLQGSTGDQNPVTCCLSSDDGQVKLEQLSNILAEGIRRALDNSSPVVVNSIGMEARSITLPRAQPDRSLLVIRLLDAERWLKRTDLPEDLRGEFVFQRDSTRVLLDRLDQGTALQTTCEIQAARIGDVLIVGHPFELFISLGNEISRLLPHYKIFVTSGTNDTIEYMPTADKFDLKVIPGFADATAEGYAYSFPAYRVPWQNGQFHFNPDVGDVVVQALVRLANDVAGESEK